jgi:hypothetical protein
MYGTIADKTLNYWLTGNSCSAYVELDDGKTLYYNLKNLEKVDCKKKKKNNTMTITGDFKVAKVKFLSGTNTNTEYEYAMFDEYHVGDTVVVSSANHGLGLAKITNIISKEDAVTKKFEREIVSSVYMDAYEERKKNRAKLAELSAKMDQRVHELNKLAIFEMMAEKDADLKDMLEEYKALIG